MVHRTRATCALLVVCVLMLGAASRAAADSITLEWDPSSTLVGYKVHVGSASGSYTQHFDVGSTTQFTFPTATAGQRYCFAVSAYVLSSLLEGPNSSEVCGYSNALPTLVNPGNRTSAVGEAVTLQLQGSDPASQPLTYSATGLPPGLTLMASTGFISGAGTTAGTYSVTARASDDTLTTSQTFTWTVTGDTSSTAIQLSLTMNKPSPQPVGTPITFAAAVSGGTAPYEFKWTLFNGVSWNMAQQWSTSPSFTWTPTAAGAGYRMAVWVRSAGNTVEAPEVSGEIGFSIGTTAAADTTPPSVAISMPTTASTYATAATSVTLSGTSLDNVSVTQVTWVSNRGGSGTASGTNGWRSGAIALQSGDNVITVTARDAAGNQASDVLTVTVPAASTAIQLLSVTMNKLSPQPVGTPITFTAAVSGGTAPYEFKWTLFNGVSWNMAQQWSTSPSFTWTPTAAGAGYQMAVWVRSAGNTIEAPEVSGEIGFAIGTVAAADTTPPSVAITTPTTAPTYATTATSVTLSGTSADNVGVTQVTWVSNRGGSGTASGTSGWSSGAIALQSGDNVITVTARDAAGNQASDVLTVTVPAASTAIQLLSVTMNKPSPQPVGTPITFTAAVSGGTAPYQFKWTLFNGVSWNMAQQWSTNPSFTWTPTAAGAGYQMAVWVRSAGNTIEAPEVSGEIGFAIGTVAAADTTPPSVAITTPTTAPTYATTATSVTLSGTSADNVGVTQVTWVSNRGGSGTASGTSGWSSGAIALQSGDNVITVTARDAAGNQASDVLTVTVPAASTAIQLLSVTMNKPSPQPVGTPITFTAAVSGGTAPYQFKWTLFNGVSWNMAQQWSTSPSFTWTPTAEGSGYRMAVWVRSAGNTVEAPEVSGEIGFSIGTAPASTPIQLSSLTMNKPSPQPVGTPITFTAAVSGGTAPYEFKWTLFNGVSWNMAQQWSTSPSFTWTPTAAGAGYQMAVWVRSAGNTIEAPEVSGEIGFAIGTVNTPTQVNATTTVNATASSTVALTAVPQTGNSWRSTKLTWSNAPWSSVDVYRNGMLVTNTPNDGSHTDPVWSQGTYTYQICAIGSTTDCSNTATVFY